MKLPKLNFDHLVRLTDDTGIVQFAKFGVGDPHSGYATDDNARALVVAARLPNSPLRDRLGAPFLNFPLTLPQPNSPLRDRLASLYLSFLLSVQQADGSFAQLALSNRSLSNAPASDDGFGRC